MPEKMYKKLKKMMSMILVFAILLTMPGVCGFDISVRTVKAAEKYRVVCVGGSTTFMEYPNYLQNVLGEEYEVINRGENATTATYIESLDKHDVNSDWPDGIFDGKSYRVTGTYQAAMKDNPDCVILMIGGNDAKTNNWEKIEAATGKTPEQKFEEDYLWLINQFRNLSSHPDIIIATTGWAQKDGLFTIVNKYVDKVVPIQKRIAEELNLQMVDINAKTKGQEDIYSDGIHYNEKGFQLLADSFAPVVRKLNSPDKCDLQVVGIKTDRTYYDGEEAKFYVTIKNTGSAVTPADVKHGVPVSVDGVCVAWCDTYFGPLQPGEEKTVAMNWGPNNKDTWTVTEGTHRITAYVDDSGFISESDEENNELSVTMTFKQKETNPEDAEKQPILKAVYDAPAGGANWYDEMLPLGNGMIGASVYGGVEKDSILINEKTLWSGGSQESSTSYPSYAYDGGFAALGQTLEAYADKAQQAWKEARKTLQDAVNTHSKDGNEDYNIPDSVNNTINEMKGNKAAFGSYQELGNIEIIEPDYIEPVITRIYADKEHRDGVNGVESSPGLFDGNVNTKYFADASGQAYTAPFTIEWDYSSAKVIESYSLTTANDAEGRDPVAWTLYGSKEASGENYEPIDQREDGESKDRYEKTTYTVGNTGTYLRYRLVVTKTRAGDPMQLSEISVNSPEKKMHYSNYQRWLDLNNAEVYVSYTSENKNYSREYFVSNPDNVMVVKLDAGGGAFSKYFRISTEQTNRTIKAEVASDGSGVITMEGQPKPDAGFTMKTGFDQALYYAQEIKIIPTGGQVYQNGDGIQVNNATSILLLMSAGTNYRLSNSESFTDFFTGIDPMIAVKACVEQAAEKGYTELKEAHREDYKTLFDRVQLQLGGASVPDKTTNQLLADYDKNNTDTEDRYLEILYYQFGRYLLIASSRENSALPANLQGLWADGLNPPWSADYHTNINLQMNYWLSESTNLSETHTPVLNYVNSLVQKGTKGVETVFGTNERNQKIRGWTIWHENNPWGNVGPAVSDAFYAPEDGAWMCMDIWEHYQFTMDREYLEENYDIIKQAALFWVDTLWEDTRDNTLVANPSYSPEHGPYSLGATEVQSVVWEVFHEVIQASEILGKSDSEVDEIIAAQKKLSGLKVGSAGQLQEWKDDTLLDISGDNNHRHANHLFGLHPGSQIVAGRSAEDDQFIEAIKNTLLTRGDGGTGWSKAWKINFWARLLDGEHAQKMVKEILTQSTTNNLLDVHPPFQIDGNFGATSGMTEMLLQSQGGTIRLLPAISSKWSTGKVSGLKARGNVEVNMTWENGILSTADFKAGSDGDITVNAPGLGDAVITNNGVRATYERINSDTVKIAAKAGQTYKVGGSVEEQTPEEVFGVVATSEFPNTITVVWGRNADKETAGQNYNVYVDDVKILSSVETTSYNLQNISAGNHIVKVTSVFAGKESSGITVEVKVSDEMVQTNAQVAINGYQISTYVEGYRTIYTVDDPDRTVVAAGLIYGLGASLSESDMVIDSANPMVRTYVATEAGKLSLAFGEGQNAQSYAMTMKFGVKTAEFFDAEICMRAYARLSDETYIYSDVESLSVYRVADELYKNQRMNTIENHNYLYDNILKIVNSEYKPVDFQWNHTIVKPEDVI